MQHGSSDTGGLCAPAENSPVAKYPVIIIIDYTVHEVNKRNIESLSYGHMLYDGTLRKTTIQYNIEYRYYTGFVCTTVTRLQ